MRKVWYTVNSSHYRNNMREIAFYSAKQGGFLWKSHFTLSEGVDSWNTIIFLYNSALKEVRTKVEILNDEFQQVHQYNPIEYIKSRNQDAREHCEKVKALRIRVIDRQYGKLCQ
mgnify:CR=1 FL=1